MSCSTEASLDRDTIVAAVETERYQALCLAARESALLRSDELSRQWSDEEIDIAHEISEMVWESALPDTDKVALLFLIYREMPTYSLIYDLHDRCSALSPEGRAELWRQVRELLSQEDDVLSAALELSMWCDFFEVPDDVGEAWAELTGEDADASLLQRVLTASGPVPYTLKEQLYQRLIGDETWHYFIYRSLLHSNFDYFGKIDRERARELLSQLRLSESTEHLVQLREALA